MLISDYESYKKNTVYERERKGGAPEKENVKEKEREREKEKTEKQL